MCRGGLRGGVFFLNLRCEGSLFYGGVYSRGISPGEVGVDYEALMVGLPFFTFRRFKGDGDGDGGVRARLVRFFSVSLLCWREVVGALILIL